MGYPDGYTPRSRDVLSPPIAEAHPAICVCVDADRSYEKGWITYEEYVALMEEYAPQMPLGPVHAQLTARMVQHLRDRVAVRMAGAR